mgnify:CR=1 FL=1
MPALLRFPKASARIPVREGRCIWLNSGRAAILWALRALRPLDSKRPRCLLPGYLCPSVVQPFKEAGFDVVFYRVDNHLQVDLDDLHSGIGSDVLAVVIIHYFGFLQPGAVFDLIESTDPPVYVIEDVTHAWYKGTKPLQPYVGVTEPEYTGFVDGDTVNGAAKIINEKEKIRLTLTPCEPLCLTCNPDYQNAR